MPEPVTAALIAGGAALAGSAFSAWSSSRQADKQMRFQERMSGSAHQREVLDLKKAGLNPALGAKFQGSSTPSGAMGQVPDYGHSAKTAVEAALVRSQIGLQSAQANQANSAAKLSDTQSGDIAATQINRNNLLVGQYRQALQQADHTDLDKLRINQEIKRLEQQTRLLEQETAHSAYGLSKSKVESDFYNGVGGKVSPYLKNLPLPGVIRDYLNRRGTFRGRR